MDGSPSVSFIGIVDFTEDARWVYCSESVVDLLGFEPHELIGRPSLELVHPDEFAQVRGIHYSTITQDQAAVLAYLRMRHKDPCRGYVLCAISRTVCQDVLVGSVSFASPGPKAMHNASTAQEVTIITPTARDFEFRRWNDPSPMPPCPVPPHLLARRPGSPPSATGNTYPARFAPLPTQSVRTALILDRFARNGTVLYCSNDSLLRTTHALGRAFFDFVAPRDEPLVRSWLDVIKGWGVNERGQPSDGGFGFGKFALLVDGRDSSERAHDGAPPARPRAKAHRAHAPAPSPKTRPKTAAAAVPVPAASTRPARGADVLRELTRERPPPAAPTRTPHAHPPALRRAPDEVAVDAIFSAHSDGVMVILRRSASGSGSGSGSGASSAGGGAEGAEGSAYTFPPPPPRLGHASWDERDGRNADADEADGGCSYAYPAR